MDLSIIVNLIKKQSVTDNIVANSSQPVVLPISPGDKVVIRSSNGEYAKNILSKKDDTDLVIMSEDSDELLRITDYFVTDNVDVVTWYDGNYVSYQFADLETGSVITQVPEGQSTALIIDVLEGSQTVNWGMAGLIGGGLAIAGIAINNSDDDDDNDNQTTPSPEPPLPTPNHPPVSEDTVISVEEDTSVSGQLAEATDPDEGQTLTYELKEQAANGTAVVKADGSYTYTPNVDYNGTDSFTYTIDDGNGGKITKTATVTVTPEVVTPPVNHPPVSEDTVISVEEDTSVSGQLAEATDPDEGQTLTYELKEQAANGTAVVKADGSYTYTPNADYNGTDSFTYTIDDGNGGKITKTATITVTPEVVTPPVNHPPVSDDTVISVEEDASVSGQLAEATDPDEGQTLTYELKEQAANGTAVVKADGSYTYTPNADFNGTDSFTYTIDDGNGGKITKTAQINIKPLINNPDITHTDNMSELTFDYTGQDESKLFSVLIDDDSIYLGGNSKNGLVLKLDAKGNLDPNYTVEVNPYIENIEEIPGMVILDDGSLFVGNFNSSRDYLSKITSEGVLDTDFKGIDPYAPGDGVFDLEYFGGWDVQWNAITKTSDNQILVAGMSRKLGSEDDLDMTIARLNADGTPDSSFNHGGQIEGERPGENVIGLEDLDDNLFSIIETADGKILAGGHFISSEGYKEMLLARFNADGTLDSSFDNGTDMPGIVTLDVDWGVSIKSIVEDAEGNIYAIGDGSNNSHHMTIVSFKPDGSLNTDFNPGGDTNGDEGSLPGVIFIKNMKPIGSKLINDNKLLLVTEETIDDPESYMVRLNLDGSLDESFNYTQKEPGIKAVRPGVIIFEDTIINSFDVNDSNEIIAVGYEKNLSNPSMTSAKVFSLDETGNYSGSFENNNPDTTPNHPPVSEDTVISVEEDDSVSGQLAEATDPDEGQTLTYELKEQAANGTAVVKADGSYTYTPNADYNGTDSFTYTIDDGNGGKITRTATIHIKSVDSILDFEVATNMSELTFVYEGQERSKISSVLIDDNGSIYIGGNDKNGLILKFDTNGILDTSYNIEANPYTNDIESVDGMAILDDGSLFAKTYNQNSDYLSKITNQGVLDSSLNGLNQWEVGDGVLDLEGFGGVDLLWNTMTATDNNKLLVAGSSRESEGDDYDITIARLNADGTEDSSFNVNGSRPGEIIIGLEGLDDHIYSIIETADGKILAAGHVENTDGSMDIMLARFNTDGSLDTSYDNGIDLPGIITYGLPWDASITNMIEGEDGNIYAIGKGIYNDSQNMTIISFKPDGSLNTSFNSGGYTEGNFGSIPGVIFVEETKPINLKLTNDNKLLLAADEGTDGCYLVKLNLDGSVDTSFNHNNTDSGVFTKEAGFVDFTNTRIASFEITESNDIIIVGHESIEGSSDSYAKIISLDETGNYSQSFTDSGNIAMLSLGEENLTASIDDYTFEGEDGSIQHFMQPIVEGENSYYYYDEDNNDSVNSANINDLLTHDAIDDLLNNGLDTSNASRSVNLDNESRGSVVELPTITELLDLYNNQEVLEQLTVNNSDAVYWSATEGESGNANTHMALNISNGQVYELADNQMAEAIFLISDII